MRVAICRWDGVRTTVSLLVTNSMVPTRQSRRWLVSHTTSLLPKAIKTFVCVCVPTPSSPAHVTNSFCPILRRKNARARARRWRKEQRRVREAEAIAEQREKELREKLREEIAVKVEVLFKHESLLEQR